MVLGRQSCKAAALEGVHLAAAPPGTGQVVVAAKRGLTGQSLHSIQIVGKEQ
jgi:hypothetical protein